MPDEVTFADVPIASSGSPRPATALHPQAATQKPLQAPSSKPSLSSEYSHLFQLLNRVENLLGQDSHAGNFIPSLPPTMAEMNLSNEDLQRLVFKFLLEEGSAFGQQIANHVKIPLALMASWITDWEQERLVCIRPPDINDDELFSLSEHGRSLAQSFRSASAYHGSAPVDWTEYQLAMERQSIKKQTIRNLDLIRALEDLVVDDRLLSSLGPALNSGRSILLYGAAGNGKTSVAQRLVSAFSETIWIPRFLNIQGQIVRLFDPQFHREIRHKKSSDALFEQEVDHRWVCIQRPSITVSSDVEMSAFEFQFDPSTSLTDAPLQLKSNCGTLIFEDLGRSPQSSESLAKRWLLPLERGSDRLTLTNQTQIDFPLDQLLIFTTDQVQKNKLDESFERRLAYKIEIPDLTLDQFRALWMITAPKFGFVFDGESFEHLVQNFYLKHSRPYRACHVRELMQQLRDWCAYHQHSKVLSPALIDAVAPTCF